jgi:hypothetical protein
MSKKIIIPRENLPNINVLTKNYEVRFRLVSEDRNRFSYWSPTFSVDPDYTYVTSESLIIEKHTGYTSATWNPVVVQKDSQSVGGLQEYDLWIRWGTDPSQGTWEYYERISATSEDFVKPTSPAGLDHVSIEIYVPGKPVLRRAMYDIFQSNGAGKVDLVNDRITLPENVFKTGYDIYYESSNPIGGLTNATNYYARMVTSTTMTLHPTEQDALDNTNKINLTSHKNDVGFFTWEGCNVCDFLLYSNYNFNPV